MRTSLVCLAAVTALAACGGPLRSHTVSPLATSRPSGIWILENRTPRCPVREVGRVSGPTWRALQNAAFRLKADAVILEPEGGNSRVVRYGTAVQYTRADCKE
jgi:hypothetical protein